MCLAIPGKVIELDENSRLGTVSIMGITREASFDLTPQVKLGDYVLLHAGFAIEIVDEQQAQETLDLLREFPELADTNDFDLNYAFLQKFRHNTLPPMYRLGIGFFAPISDFLFITHTFYRENLLWSIEILSFW